MILKLVNNVKSHLNLKSYTKKLLFWEHLSNFLANLESLVNEVLLKHFRKGNSFLTLKKLKNFLEELC